MAEPSVSAVIAAFDSERFVGAAIESVLAQTVAPVDLVVVDDGSSDRTASVAAGYGDRVRLIVQPNVGVAAARNRGAAETAGEFLAFLDADDTWRPERLERQLAALDGAEAGLCASAVTGERPPMGRTVRMRPASPTLDSLLLWRGTVVPASSNLVISRSAFEQCGGYDESYRLVPDFDLLLQLVARGRLRYLDEPLVDYTWHADNRTRDLAGIERELERAYAAAFARDGDRIEISPRRADGGRHRMLAAAHFRIGDRREALSHLARAAARDPGVLTSLAASALRRG